MNISFALKIATLLIPHLAATALASAAPAPPPSSASAVSNITIRPLDTGEALVNPDMGWTMHFYSNIPENYGSKLEPSDTLDDFPGLSTVYLRVPWAFLEPEEGKFNWALLDTPAQRWIAKGKRVAFRVTCSENWMPYATPGVGAQGRRQGLLSTSSAKAAAENGCIAGTRTSATRSFCRSSSVSWPPWPRVTTATPTWLSSTSAPTACGARATPS